MKALKSCMFVAVSITVDDVFGSMTEGGADIEEQVGCPIRKRRAIIFDFTEERNEF